MKGGRILISLIERIMYLGPLSLIRYPAKLLRIKEMGIYIKRVGVVRLRPSGSDLGTFAQVFGSGEYNLGRFEQNKRLGQKYNAIISSGSTPLIIDAGANIGAATIWFKKLYPKATIVAIEPDFENVKLLRINTRDYDGIRIIAGAIGSWSGRVAIANPNDGSSAFQVVRDECGSIDVVTIQDVFESVGDKAIPFIAKIDIEGYEADLFLNSDYWLSRFSAIFIEIHDWMLPGRGSSQALQAAILGKGFEIILLGETIALVKN